MITLKQAATDTLSITGGSLAIAADSTLVGPLSMTDGSLTASGTGVSLSATGATAAGATSIKNLESIGKDLAMASVNAAKGGSAEDNWRKETLDRLSEIAENTEDFKTAGKRETKDFLNKLPWAAANTVIPGSGTLLSALLK